MTDHSKQLRAEQRALHTRSSGRAPYAEHDCGWRWKPWPRFRVTIRYEGGVWHVYEVYAGDGHEMLVEAFGNKAQAVAFGWAHRSDDA